MEDLTKGERLTDHSQPERKDRGRGKGKDESGLGAEARDSCGVAWYVKSGRKKTLKEKKRRRLPYRCNLCTEGGGGRTWGLKEGSRKNGSSQGEK